MKQEGNPEGFSFELLLSGLPNALPNEVKVFLLSWYIDPCTEQIKVKLQMKEKVMLHFVCGPIGGPS